MLPITKFDTIACDNNNTKVTSKITKKSSMHDNNNHFLENDDDDDDDCVSLTETESVRSCPVTEEEIEHDALNHSCDACFYCNDSCDNVEHCQQCQAKKQQQQQQRLLSPDETYYTMCEIKRHNHEASCWIIVNDKVYDVTNVLACHPGGVECILRRAGGARNCYEDYEFHSKKGQFLFRQYYIGKIKSCPSTDNKSSSTNNNSNNNNNKNDGCWWSFWKKVC